jgi:hypothetical protein
MNQLKEELAMYENALHDYQTIIASKYDESLPKSKQHIFALHYGFCAYFLHAGLITLNDNFKDKLPTLYSLRPPKEKWWPQPDTRFWFWFENKDKASRIKLLKKAIRIVKIKILKNNIKNLLP